MRGNCSMKKILAALAVTVTLVPFGAAAEERTGDAALGALAGAVVLGPIGLVADAAVGYTAGPSVPSRTFRQTARKGKRQPIRSNPALLPGRACRAARAIEDARLEPLKSA
jgi:hypothetical protein